jgi:hypothetical protein
MMKKAAFVFILMLGATAAAVGADQVLGPHRKLEGVYRIYGGGLGDPVAPTAKDRKVMFSITGEAARELFDALGPDKKDVCTAGSGTRVRARDNDNLFCMRTAEGDYSCNFGFDLRNGKSIGGIVC